MSGILSALLTAVLSLALADPSSAQEAVGSSVQLKPINIGFVRHAYGTWTARIADGGFERSTGRSLRWFAYDADSAAMAALASGRLDLALVGTGVLSAALARGLDLRIFYVLGTSAESDGMVIGDSMVFRFAEPKTLQSSVIAVPYGSTAHLRILDSLRRWGLSLPAMRIVNLQAAQIAEAWRRKEIDAAVLSEPLLGRIAANGRIVPLPATTPLTGVQVYVGAADFVAQHIVFLSRFVEIISRADLAFSGISGQLGGEQEVVRSIAFITGLTPAEVVAALARYRPPTLAEQAGPGWLGGGADSPLLTELKANAATWRWSGRLTGPDLDLSSVLAPEPVAMALTYQPK